MRISVFTNRVALRIFILLIIAALIPVTIMATLSLRQVESITIEQVSRNLRQEAKLFGLSVYDRLLHIEDKLSFYKSVLESGQGDRITNERDRTQISDLIYTNIKTGKSEVFGEHQTSLSFNDVQMNHMQEGNSVITVMSSNKRSPQIYISRLVNYKHEETSILSAQINKIYLWGDDELFESDTALCVFRTGVKYLHCSGDVDNPLTRIISDGTELNSTSFNQAVNSDDLLVGRWRLFLKARYAQDEWIILLLKNRAVALSKVEHFSTNYLLVILVALIFVILFSINLIRNHTKPLEALMNGIRRLSDNRFDSKVTVQSRDEFGEVAAAFNDMSDKIGSQIERLQTQAEIDQLILSRPSINDIIKIAIEGVERLIPCEWSGIALSRNEENKVFQLSGKQRTECNINDLGLFTISPHRYQMISSGNPLLELEDDDKFIASLDGISERPCSFWLGFHIVVMDEPPSILIIGCNSKLLSDDLDHLQEFSSRIAVAISNAAWEEKLYHQAHYDNLTKLPNRLLMYDRLQQELNHIKRTGDVFAVLFLDLDRFKNINDSLGHEYGDRLLEVMANRIKTCIRQDDTVARLGGDEFIVLLRSLGSAKKAMGISSLVAEKLITDISRPVKLNQHDIRITTSIGIVVSPNDGIDSETLLRNADSAMYHAKDQGRSNFQFYSDALNKSARYRLDMESRLRKALEEEEFTFHYQPKIDPITGSITSAEALLRWNDKNEGIIYPDKYIHIAEDIGLTTHIGIWGLKVVCKKAKIWNNLRTEPLRISINISPQHFLQGNLVKQVQAALRESRLDPSMLEIEVTESTAMMNIDHSVMMMEELREMGVIISIDDFGTGYSSLAHLKHFPAYSLKIDRIFVSQIAHSDKDKAIVESIILLAHNLGLKVIAEGVETKEQLDILVSMQCDKMQGYLFSKPLPEDQFVEFIKQGIDITNYQLAG